MSLKRRERLRPWRSDVFTAPRRSVYTLVEPLVINSHEGKTFKQTIQYQLSQKLNQKNVTSLHSKAIKLSDVVIFTFVILTQILLIGSVSPGYQLLVFKQ